ncbi:ubiquitin hydrolase L3 [Cordyceps fumosorosea ARSEF 2679]|uniref:Ubiquitin carboxyl-terminal hydrolase n=1 Tax=Cordyceps fumosorosea (strain ARSEF 2679) TaxID=1081104 RepID=A0A167NL17_CORFA|nr:ubiquitin hydrolase L3 [Cordyceps fumosorosea ARSEF 2679]OAA55671.1 ubiquitin hydrolase L3 [Cordyceps fumosorosea ARSEF 2679]
MSTANPDSGAGVSAFIPLECNPVRMTALLKGIDESSPLQFYDVISIPDARLINLHIPHPALALLLVFSSRTPPEELRYRGSGADEPVVWWRQTVKNSCGTMALLHAACNGPARDLIDKTSTLGKLLDESIPKGPEERARLLERSKELADEHQKAAEGGDTEAPEATDDVEPHYVCFVAGTDGALYEMDGRKSGPVKLGDLGGEADMLSETALDLGARKYIKPNENFSSVVLAAGSQ